MADRQEVVDRDNVVTEGERIAVIVVSVLIAILVIIQIALLLYCFCRRRCAERFPCCNEKEKGIENDRITTVSDEELLIREEFVHYEEEKPVEVSPIENTPIRDVNNEELGNKEKKKKKKKKKKKGDDEEGDNVGEDDDQKEKGDEKNEGQIDPEETARKLEIILSPESKEPEEPVIRLEPPDTDPEGKDHEKIQREEPGIETEDKKKTLDEIPPVPGDLENKEKKKKKKKKKKPRNEEDDGGSETGVKDDSSGTGVKDDGTKTGVKDDDTETGVKDDDKKKNDDKEGKDDPSRKLESSFSTEIQTKQEPVVRLGPPDTDPRGRDQEKHQGEEQKDEPGSESEDKTKSEEDENKKQDETGDDDVIMYRQHVEALLDETSEEELPLMRDSGEIRGRGTFRRPISEMATGSLSSSVRFHLHPIGVVEAWTENQKDDKTTSGHKADLSTEEDQGFSEDSVKQDLRGQGHGEGIGRHGSKGDQGTAGGGGRNGSKDGQRFGSGSGKKGSEDGLGFGDGSGRNRSKDRGSDSGRKGSKDGQGFGDGSGRDDSKDGQGFGDGSSRAGSKGVQGFGDGSGRAGSKDGQGFGDGSSRDGSKDGQGFGDGSSRDGSKDGQGFVDGSGRDGSKGGQGFGDGGGRDGSKDGQGFGDGSGRDGHKNPGNGKGIGKKESKEVEEDASPRGKNKQENGKKSKGKKTKGKGEKGNNSSEDDEVHPHKTSGRGGLADIAEEEKAVQDSDRHKAKERQKDKPEKRNRGNKEGEKMSQTPHERGEEQFEDSGISDEKGSVMNDDKTKQRRVPEHGLGELSDVSSLGSFGLKYWPDDAGIYRGWDQHSSQGSGFLDDLNITEIEFDENNKLMRSSHGTRFWVSQPEVAPSELPEAKKRKTSKRSRSRSKGREGKQRLQIKGTGNIDTVTSTEEEVSEAESARFGRSIGDENVDQTFGHPREEGKKRGSRSKTRHPDGLKLGRGMPVGAVLEDEGHPGTGVRQGQGQGQGHGQGQGQETDRNLKQSCRSRELQGAVEGIKKESGTRNNKSGKYDDQPGRKTKEKRLRKSGELVEEDSNFSLDQSRLEKFSSNVDATEKAGPSSKGTSGMEEDDYFAAEESTTLRRMRRRNKAERKKRGRGGRNKAENKNSWDAYLQYGINEEMMSPLALIFLESDDDYR